MERAAVLALLTAGYAAWAIVSILYLQFDNGVAGLWLPNVFAIAMLLRNPGLRLPAVAAAVFVASMLANRLLGTDFELCALYSLANTISVAAGAALIGKVCGDRKSAISGARDYAIMLLIGGLVAPSLAATLFSSAVAQSLDWQPLQTFWRWVAGEGLGFAVLFPILMMLSRVSLAGLLGAKRLARLSATIGASTLFALAAASWTQFPLLMVIVPLMLAAAFLAPLDMAVACGAVGATLIGLVAAGTLPGLDPSNGGFAFGFQLAVGIVVVLPLLGALIIEQTRVDRRRIAESEQRFRRAMEDSAIGVVVVGLDGRIVESNPAFAAMLGYARHEIETLTFFQITHPDDIALGAETMAAGALRSERIPIISRSATCTRTAAPVWTRLSGSVIRDSETGAPLILSRRSRTSTPARSPRRRIAEAETRWSFALASAGQGALGLRRQAAAPATIRRSGSRCWATAKTSSTRDPDLWLSLVHPDDRDAVAAADRAHIGGQDAVLRSRVPHAAQARPLDLDARSRQGAGARRDGQCDPGDRHATPTSPGASRRRSA